MGLSVCLVFRLRLVFRVYEAGRRSKTKTLSHDGIPWLVRLVSWDRIATIIIPTRLCGKDVLG